ncbi:MAG: alpha/beta fold hydrolase [Alicyclobacillaceae bacterium]|nr:alpha/beta fold hydrolase [Alicyclobacillaceae bacterium]
MVSEQCVALHGFTGSPADLEPLVRRLEATGYAVACPVLPGHCGTKEDLRTATAPAWLQCGQSAVEAALQAGGPVHLIGFSMGAMIAGWLAARYPVATLTMLAPAVYYASPRPLLRHTAELIKRSFAKGGPTLRDLRSRLDRVSQTPLFSVQQFRRLVRMAKPELAKVTAPLCVVQGQRDELVEPAGAEYVFQTVASQEKEIHRLPRSGHMVCFGPEAEAVCRIVLTFLERHRRSY